MIFQSGPKKLICQHHFWGRFTVGLPKLWNRCFSLAAHFGISLGAAPSASQMSEVKHVISDVGRRLPLCSITWYLLRGCVNKHRCTIWGWGCSLNAIVPWWVQFLPPQRMNSYRWRKQSVEDNERTVFYIPGCGKQSVQNESHFNLSRVLQIQ